MMHKTSNFAHSIITYRQCSDMSPSSAAEAPEYHFAYAKIKNTDFALASAKNVEIVRRRIAYARILEYRVSVGRQISCVRKGANIAAGAIFEFPLAVIVFRIFSNFRQNVLMELSNENTAV